MTIAPAPAEPRTDAPSDSAPVRPQEDGEDFRYSGKGSSPSPPSAPPAPAPAAPSLPDWEELSQGFHRNLRAPSLRAFADGLGLSVESLERLGVGFDRFQYTFPMRDGEGRIVGIRTRPVKGGKGTMQGGALGLFIPAGVTAASAEAITEGESDLAAALTIGVGAIGKPSAGFAPRDVLHFFRDCPVACPCIIGDNDEREGRRGAEDTAEALVDTGIPCRVLIPPGPHKDLREWVRAGLTGEELRRQIAAQEIRWPPDWPPGFAQVSNALPRRGVIARIGSGAFALLCLLASFDGGKGKVYPGRSLLAELIGVSVSTIDRDKRILEACGLLTWRPGRTARGNEYAVNFGPERWAHPRKTGGRKEKHAK